MFRIEVCPVTTFVIYFQLKLRPERGKAKARNTLPYHFARPWQLTELVNGLSTSQIVCCGQTVLFENFKSDFEIQVTSDHVLSVL